jgi:hypothetical protein
LLAKSVLLGTQRSFYGTMLAIATQLFVDDSHHKDFTKGHFSYKTDRNVKWEKQFQSDCYSWLQLVTPFCTFYVPSYVTNLTDNINTFNEDRRAEGVRD